MTQVGKTIISASKTKNKSVDKKKQSNNSVDAKQWYKPRASWVPCSCLGVLSVSPCCVQSCHQPGLEAGPPGISVIVFHCPSEHLSSSPSCTCPPNHRALAKTNKQHFTDIHLDIDGGNNVQIPNGFYSNKNPTKIPASQNPPNLVHVYCLVSNCATNNKMFHYGQVFQTINIQICKLFDICSMQMVPSNVHYNN